MATHRTYTHKRLKCSNGVYVRSQFERDVLENALTNGQPAEYEPRAFEYSVLIERTYTPDFVLPNGLWVECKGYFTPEDRRKMMWLRKSFPHQRIALLFQKDNTLGRGSKTRYSEWAERKGFLWHVGDTIPPTWFNL
jgi:hypothetical protein